MVVVLGLGVNGKGQPNDESEDWDVAQWWGQVSTAT